MKKLLVLVVLAVAVAIWYRSYREEQAPVRVLTAYADAVASGRHDLARQFADGDLAGAGAGERHAAAGWVPVQELRGVHYRVDSRTASADGNEVALVVTQTVGFNPPGVESALRPAMQARFRLQATVRSTASGWKVVAFSSEFLEADDAVGGR